MLENINKYQRGKLKSENVVAPSPERRALRHQTSTDNVNAPPFNIPNLRVEQRKTSSAEDMARKNSVTAPPPTTSATGSATGFKSKDQILQKKNEIYSMYGNNNNKFQVQVLDSGSLDLAIRQTMIATFCAWQAYSRTAAYPITL